MLAGLMTTLEVISVLRGVTAVDTQEFVPAIRDWNKLWIDCSAKARDNAGQGIVEVFVLSAPETMPFHHDAAAEKVVALIKAGYLFGFVRGEQVFDDRVAFRVEIVCDLIPVDCRNCAGGSHFIQRLPEPPLAYFRFHALKLAITPSNARWSRTVDRTVSDPASRRPACGSTFRLSQPCHRP